MHIDLQFDCRYTHTHTKANKKTKKKLKKVKIEGKEKKKKKRVKRMCNDLTNSDSKICILPQRKVKEQVVVDMLQDG